MDDRNGGVVIVGGGLAGAKAAEALRAAGYSGDVTLLAAERELPYERPPLSKGYLLRRSEFDDAVVHGADWYAENRVELRLGIRAESIDRVARQVTVTGGERLGYDRLLLATGSTPRRLSVPGADARGVLYLRTRADSDALRDLLGSGGRLVIIGAGWIGLEVAAAARDSGMQVTIVEMAPLPLVGVFGPEIGGMFADLHRAHGVELHLGAQLEEIVTTDGAATGVRLSDGTVLAADAVLVGIGARPNVELALSAGLDVEDGVQVDAALRTSDPHIFAVGDIAQQAHPTLGVRVRVEHWATALNQPATAVAAMLGEPAAYDKLPYFFSDQYDLGLEYLGHVPRDCATELVLRGDLGSRTFVAFWLDPTSRIRAVMNVNVWDVVDAVRPLIVQGIRVDPARLADPTIDYADVAIGGRDSCDPSTDAASAGRPT
jgi:3-phenylpropionate/trans-cinnamate dioxygenase ferredoxin reductase component